MSNKIVFAGMLVAALSLLAQRGVAQDSPQFHKEPWPIHHWFRHQPTQRELRVLHLQDVSPNEAREIDRLYDQLMSGSEKVSQVTAPTRTLTGTRAGIGATPPTHRVVASRHAKPVQQLYDSVRSFQCNDDLNAAINGGRAPSMRYPVPKASCAN